MTIRWNGDAIKAKALEAAKVSVDLVMSEAVAYAKQNHPGWHNQTGAAEGSVQVVSFAQEEGDRVRGTWGSVAVDYVIWLELKHGSFLRSSASANYPHLRQYIADRMKAAS